MDDFKTICIYENLPIFAYFFKRQEGFSCLFKKKFNRFKYLSTLETFKLRMLCVHLYLFVVYILFAPVISINIHHCVNNFPDIKVLMMVIETETFNVDFSSQ